MQWEGEGKSVVEERNKKGHVGGSASASAWETTTCRKERQKENGGRAPPRAGWAGLSRGGRHPLNCSQIIRHVSRASYPCRHHNLPGAGRLPHPLSLSLTEYVGKMYKYTYFWTKMHANT